MRFGFLRFQSSTRAQPLGVGGHDPLNILNLSNCEKNFYWPPILDSAHVRLKCFLYVFIEQSIISRFSFQLFTSLNNEKFEIPNIFWGLTKPPPQIPHLLFLGLCPRFRLRPKNLGHFAPLIPTFPQLPRGCAQDPPPVTLMPSHFQVFCLFILSLVQIRYQNNISSVI